MIFMISISMFDLVLGASLVAQLVKNPPAIQETRVQSLNWENPLEREWLPTPVGENTEENSMESQRVGHE